MIGANNNNGPEFMVNGERVGFGDKVAETGGFDANRMNFRRAIPNWGSPTYG